MHVVLVLFALSLAHAHGATAAAGSTDPVGGFVFSVPYQLCLFDVVALLAARPLLRTGAAWLRAAWQERARLREQQMQQAQQPVPPGKVALELPSTPAAASAPTTAALAALGTPDTKNEVCVQGDDIPVMPDPDAEAPSAPGSPSLQGREGPRWMQSSIQDADTEKGIEQQQVLWGKVALELSSTPPLSSTPAAASAPTTAALAAPAARYTKNEVCVQGDGIITIPVMPDPDAEAPSTQGPPSLQGREGPHRMQSSSKDADTENGIEMV